MYSFKENNLDKIKTFIRNLEDGNIEKSDKEKLINMIRPTVGIKTKTSDDKKLEVGKSKIGGKPDLPKNFSWPKADNKSMLFCAQYNLSEITKFDKEKILPNKGFFYIFISFDIVKFLYSESENIVRTEFPKDLEENQAVKTSLIEYFEFYTIPDDENYKLFELDNKYDDLNFYFYQPTEEFIVEAYQNIGNIHQILGHDRSIQSSVVYDFASKELGLYLAENSEYEKRWNEVLELSKTYELLLQLDCCDSKSDLDKLGGTGTYYFGLTKTNLEKRNFNDIIMSFQTT